MGKEKISVVSEATLQDFLVVKTKLLPLAFQGRITARANLLQALQQAASKYPVTLVSAPAGYGKTTLVSALYQDNEK